MPKGVTRVATTMAVPVLLRENRIDPAVVLAEFGVDPVLYDEPENRIPFATSCRILERCAKVTGCPHFGLLVGQRAGISALGALGFLMQSSPDVRTALEAATLHFRVHNGAAVLELVEEDDFVALGFTILQPGIEDHEQLLDGVMATSFNVMRSLCGHHWLPAEVRFAHAPPRDSTPFRQLFHAPLVFDGGESAMVFARHWLDQPLPSADPLLHAMMKGRVEDMASHQRAGLVGQLRRMLPALVAARTATADAAARRLGIGIRTLNRRLATEQTSFRLLHEETCRALARQLLRETHMPAHQVADRLGYANASAFSRAFRRWEGVTPARWRASEERRRKRR